MPSYANPQSLNRYSYVVNNPLRYTDPTGRKPCADPGEYCEDEKTTIRRSIESKYKVKVKGKWSADELLNLRIALGKTASYVGGVDNLNSAFISAAQKWVKGSTSINIERIAQSRWNPSSTKPSAAAWCGGNEDGACSKNSLLLADDAFSSCYQNNGAGCGRGPDYRRPASFSLSEKIQFTIAHELTHVLADANGASVQDYRSQGLGEEEDMANELAAHIISGGTISTSFSTQAAGYWNTP